MGYYSNFSGSIQINPPIPWDLIKNSDYLPSNKKHTSIIFLVETIHKETNTGEAITKQAISIIPYSEDAYKGYDILQELNDIIKSFPTFSFTGEIRREGEDTGDISRYISKGNKVEEFKPKIIWPDGLEE